MNGAPPQYAMLRACCLFALNHKDKYRKSGESAVLCYWMGESTWSNQSHLPIVQGSWTIPMSQQNLPVFGHRYTLIGLLILTAKLILFNICTQAEEVSDSFLRDWLHEATSSQDCSQTTKFSIVQVVSIYLRKLHFKIQAATATGYSADHLQVPQLPLSALY